jgi:ribosomal protein S18 acetylase RimI-like enzyme
MTQSYVIRAHLSDAKETANSNIRRASKADLPEIVSIHERAFSQHFLSQMGSDFLIRYYQLVLTYHRGIALIGETGGLVNGFACGFVDPSAFYRLMRRCGHTFVVPAACALLRHPSLLTGMARGIRRIREAASHSPTQSCELSSIAVAPEVGRTGLGATLAQAFLAQAWSMNATIVRLYTDVNGNDVANAFYRKIGFREYRTFLQHKGRWMSEYVIARLGGADVSEPRYE